MTDKEDIQSFLGLIINGINLRLKGRPCPKCGRELEIVHMKARCRCIFPIAEQGDEKNEVVECAHNQGPDI